MLSFIIITTVLGFEIVGFEIVRASGKCASDKDFCPASQAHLMRSLQTPCHLVINGNMFVLAVAATALTPADQEVYLNS